LYLGANKRHQRIPNWIYATKIPKDWFEEDGAYNLVLEGLDYCGEIDFNGIEVCKFEHAFVPHKVNLVPHFGIGNNELKIVFHMPPRMIDHDRFPCTTSTSLVDFDGRVRPTLKSSPELFKNLKSATYL
jgi:hypothetical protein